MKKLIIFLALLSFFITARADGFSEIPTKWRVESYGANGVVLWHTPSTCNTGQIVLFSNATLADHNRLYATVLAAKASNLSVFIYYTNNSGVCVITSFGLD